MNIKITARKFRAHDSLREFIKDEVSSLEKFYDQILDVDVKLSFVDTQVNIKTVEIIVKVPKQILVASSDTDDFKKSVNESIEKIIRQLDKLKTKKNNYKNEID
ncbi:MAG: ribosomal subunit interface protein [Chlorobiaceae bacterium]|nr:ribosomal subunit interface protein [Chlorobiaceae bacterium]MBA4308751.1 ribosomal subunit interface protein [Chlorobiaceae bacterium]